MSEKRKPATRNRGERPLKRRSPSLPQRAKRKSPSPEEETPPAVTSSRGGLPTSVRPQELNLPATQYKSIAESGVLALSVEKSRQQWLAATTFEKFWTKPSKKKNIDSQNPARESMVKLGVCSMVIEPHVFEVTLYSVKASQYTFLPPVGQFQQQGFSGPALAPASAHLQVHLPSTPPVHTHKPILPNPPLTAMPQALAEPAATRAEAIKPPLLSQDRSLPPTLTPIAQAPPRPEPVRPTAPQADPIIQMLASRASTDQDLKALMKVVANGSASPQQLRLFQGHIDELNAIIRRQPRSSDSNPPPHPSLKSFEPVRPVASTPNPTSRSFPVPGPGPAKPNPLSQYYSQPVPVIKSKAPTPQRAEVSAVVFEFNGSGGDRYLIPKYSILEYLPGNMQVLVSFIATRKGAYAVGGTYKTDTEYAQPVTLRLSSHQPRILEPLAKVIASADEVRKHMVETMKRTSGTNNAYLMTRLPREEDVSDEKLVEADGEKEEQFLKVYEPPNSLLPLPYRPAKK